MSSLEKKERQRERYKEKTASTIIDWKYNLSVEHYRSKTEWQTDQMIFNLSNNRLNGPADKNIERLRDRQTDTFNF